MPMETHLYPSENTVSIPAPYFLLYELVTFYGNGEQIPTRITVRQYDLDKDLWLYGIGDRDGLFNRSLLERRS
jgi:hypothetical protein